MAGTEQDDQGQPSAIARAILERWPGLSHRQAAVLGAVTVMPSVHGAAKAAGCSHVTVYGWLGRFPKRPEDAVPLFIEAWPVCLAMGKEAYVARAIQLSESLNDKGNACAPSVMAKILGGFDPIFSGSTALQLGDTQRVKRIILEREGEEPAK